MRHGWRDCQAPALIAYARNGLRDTCAPGISMSALNGGSRGFAKTTSTATFMRNRRKNIARANGSGRRLKRIGKKYFLTRINKYQPVKFWIFFLHRMQAFIRDDIFS